MQTTNKSNTGGVILSNNSNIFGSNNIIGGCNNSSININIPEKGYQKIIKSYGTETTIEAIALDYSKIEILESVNREFREELKNLRKRYNSLHDKYVSLLESKNK